MGANSTAGRYSLNKRMLGFLITVLGFLISLILIINFYVIYQFNLRIIESNQRTLDYSLSQIERSMNEIDDMMVSLSASNANFAALMAGANNLQAHLASYDMIEQLRNVARAYTAADAFFIYSTASNSYRDTFKSTYSYMEKQEISHWLREVVRLNRFSYSDAWITRNIAGKPYIMRFYGGRGTYLIALSTFETLGDVGFFSDQDIQVGFMTTGGHQSGLTLGLRPSDLSAGNAYYHVDREGLMVLYDHIGDTDANLFLTIPDSGYWHGLSPLHIILLIASLSSILLIPLVMVWLRRNVKIPLAGIKNTIQAIRSGQSDVQSPDYRIQEFQEVSITFNEMIRRIQDLKIEAYEQKIETQQAQLQYLKLQIRPHFYLNCLKGIYAVAGQNDSAKIQKMILAVSDHLRYIFRDQLDLVSLGDEITHIRNYITIQQLFSANKPILHIDVDPDMLEFEIPPLSLSTLVENSIQHQSEEQPVIHVRAAVIDDHGQSILLLGVQDNGKGFSDDVLKEINRDDDYKIYATNHVGTRNIRQRLRLIYGDQVMLAFYNTTGGPVSEIYIPFSGKGEKDDTLNR